ncbi:hypothetical protein HNY73_007798 [Argiope bruennichi]|uniref:BTB domain-containing protein n=1 Tax=Argiope bruennichi TaxID=94029 RepID=A0A8T0FHN9_ARGBR|nr:hypothetical protein HNY73_007798 [Argiope bruennichi]
MKDNNFKSKTTEQVYKRHRNPSRFIESFCATEFPNGVGEDTEGWLVVLPSVDAKKAGWIPKNDTFSCIVSVVDCEGNSRLPRSFEEIPYDYSRATYVERSFLLGRDEEFLPEGVLTLSCDFYFTWIGSRMDWGHSPEVLMDGYSIKSENIDDFLESIPQAVCIKSGIEKGYPSDSYIVCDFTRRILTLPQFRKLRKDFGFDGIPSQIFDLVIDTLTKTLWNTFGYLTPSQTGFFCSSTNDNLDQGKSNLGRLLVETSPVIRCCVNTSMKDQREKRFEFLNVDSQTFKIVLFFLENGTFPPSEFHELVEVCKMSHLHEMKDLQIKCSKYMARCFELSTYYMKILRIADFHSDEYLKSLTLSCDREYCDRQMKHSLVIKEDRADFDSYT